MKFNLILFLIYSTLLKAQINNCENSLEVSSMNINQLNSCFNIGLLDSDLKLHMISINNQIVTEDFTENQISYIIEKDTLVFQNVSYVFDTTFESGGKLTISLYLTLNTDYLNQFQQYAQALSVSLTNDLKNTIQFKKRKVDFEYIDTLIINGIYKNFIGVKSSSVLYMGGGSSIITKRNDILEFTTYDSLQRMDKFESETYVLHNLTSDKIQLIAPHLDSYINNKYIDLFGIEYGCNEILVRGYYTENQGWELIKIQDWVIKDEIWDNMCFVNGKLIINSNKSTDDYFDKRNVESFKKSEFEISPTNYTISKILFINNL